jgi:hypothetical protein
MVSSSTRLLIAFLSNSSAVQSFSNVESDGRQCPVTNFLMCSGVTPTRRASSGAESSISTIRCSSRALKNPSRSWVSAISTFEYYLNSVYFKSVDLKKSIRNIMACNTTQRSWLVYEFESFDQRRGSLRRLWLIWRASTERTWGVLNAESATSVWRIS